MKIEFSALTLGGSESREQPGIREQIELRLRFALGRFSDRVRRLRVMVRDEMVPAAAATNVACWRPH